MKKLMMVFLLLFSNILFAQKVVRVNEGYVLISTDKDVGEVGEIVELFRDVDGEPMLVGQVLIIKFVDGMTACKVHGGYINEGDYIRSYEERLIGKLFPKEKKAPSFNPRKNRKTKQTEIGILGGLLVPTGEMDDAFTTSINLGGFVSISSSNYYQLFIEFAYTFLSFKPEYRSSDPDVSASIFVINVYERFLVNPFFFFDFGGGIYFPRESVSTSGFTGDDTGFGVCLGPAFQVYNSPLVKIYLSCKYHTFNADGEWLDFAKADVQFAF